ncbi:MAG: serine/threonine protein kinase [Pyrinomonadaceae bacterium]|nr:serine/threonine protein kinase [Pyrinomonadaceae bacterium]
MNLSLIALGLQIIHHLFMLTDGKKLDGRYLLEREIGSGGFGAVYLATDTRFSGNNQVAIKQITLNNEQATKSFRLEADLLYNLSHPNLPKVTNCFRENGANFIVMEYVSGEDLAASLKKGNHFSVEETLRIADKVLDALEYLHSFLIYHRDIKPDNIKIDESGKIYLLDFGTAKGNLEEMNLSQFGGQSLTGFTPFYAPLEQVLRVDPNSFLLLRSLDSPHLETFLQRKTDERSDIYGLGATLYHLLTAHLPDRATATIRAFSLWSGKPDPLPPCGNINPEVSFELAQIINRCLEIEPDKRFQTAKELRRTLKNLSAAESSPPIADLPTITIPPESNAAVSVSNSSIKQTAIFLPQSFSPPVESKSESFVTSGGETKNEAVLFPTVEREPVSMAAVTKSETTLPPTKNPFAEAKNNLPRLKSKLPIYLGLALVFLVLSSFGGWLALRNLLEITAKKIEPPKTETLKTETSAPTATKNLRSLSYFLSVQKMRDKKPFQEPFQSSGQEIFENDYRFKLYFSLPDDGYFYAFAEGLDENGKTVLKIQFPTPKSNDGKAEVSANRRYETSQSQFDGNPGTEKFWIVWSREQPEAAEAARADAFKNKGVVIAAETRNKLKSYLENAAKNKTNAEKEVDKKITTVEFEGDSVAYLIQLEHR